MNITLPSMYTLLNDEAKNWWYHKQLRSQGQTVEARKRERQSIKNHVDHIRKALQCKGTLTIYNYGWVLQLPTGSLSGYGGLYDDSFVQACYKAGIPINDKKSRFERNM